MNNDRFPLTDDPSSTDPSCDFGPTSFVASPSEAGFALGSIFAGRLKIVKQLGHGGMGRVYRATDLDLNRDVALKVPHSVHHPEFLERFKREAQTSAQLSHPNICEIYRVGEHGGQPYIEMKLIEGISLEEYLKQRAKPLDPIKAAKIVREVAIALHEAHNKKIYHRDLKPANIMISREDCPVVMDFGLAKAVELEGEPLTSVGRAFGTPHYMPIEQFRDAASIDHRADVYSLGVILYRMLTSQVPYPGQTMESVMLAILQANPIIPSAHRPDLDPYLERICLKAIAQKAGDRFPSMDRFREALDDLLTRDLSSSTASIKSPNAGDAIHRVPNHTGLVAYPGPNPDDMGDLTRDIGGLDDRHSRRIVEEIAEIPFTLAGRDDIARTSKDAPLFSNSFGFFRSQTWLRSLYIPGSLYGVGIVCLYGVLLYVIMTFRNVGGDPSGGDISYTSETVQTPLNHDFFIVFGGLTFIQIGMLIAPIRVGRGLNLNAFFGAWYYLSTSIIAGWWTFALFCVFTRLFKTEQSLSSSLIFLVPCCLIWLILLWIFTISRGWFPVFFVARLLLSFVVTCLVIDVFIIAVWLSPAASFKNEDREILQLTVSNLLPIIPALGPTVVAMSIRRATSKQRIQDLTKIDRRKARSLYFSPSILLFVASLLVGSFALLDAMLNTQMCDTIIWIMAISFLCIVFWWAALSVVLDWIRGDGNTNLWQQFRR